MQILRDLRGRFVKGNRGFWAGKKHPKESKMLVDFNCSQCGSSSKSYVSNNRKFCSIQCSRIGQDKAIGMRNFNWKGGKPKCIDCGKETVSYEAKKCGSCNNKSRVGVNNAAWKGDEVGYVALHNWVHQWRGKPTSCEHCGVEGEILMRNDGMRYWSIQWANKSGEYLRDLTDWLGLCISCHRVYDSQRKQEYATT